MIKKSGVFVVGSVVSRVDKNSAFLNFGVHFLDVPLKCPYDLDSPCPEFNINLGRAVCSKGGFRCRFLPYWVVTSVSCVCYAVLKDGFLHV